MSYVPPHQRNQATNDGWQTTVPKKTKTNNNNNSQTNNNQTNDSINSNTIGTNDINTNTWNKILSKKDKSTEVVHDIQVQNDELDSPRSQNSETSESKTGLQRRRLKHHPFYYEYGIDTGEWIEGDIYLNDIEKWAWEDWNEFEGEVENIYGVPWLSIERFKKRWFEDHYGCGYYHLKALYYDFNKYQYDLNNYFSLV